MKSEFIACDPIFGTGKTGWILAVVAQAVLFGLAHSYQGVTGILMVTGVGLTMGAAWLLTGRNLWVSIITHGFVDFFQSSQSMPVL